MPAPRPGRGAASPAKRLRELEKQIETTEARMAELTTLLANPETYRTADVARLSAEYEGLGASIDPLYAEWSQLAEG